MTHTPPPAPGLPAADAKRIDDLLTRLTLDERIALLHQFTPGVERLGLAAFRTGQEALHGVAWMGPATVFPQAVGLGATWNEDLVRRVGDAVSAEIRAMRARDDRVGLNVWAPTVNLLRHPLWGRGEEGYSEDPHLTAALATAYTRGLRGDHPVYWRTAPVLKHWLAHNNETGRDVTSSSVRPRVLHEYDLRAFRRPVEAGAVAGVMPAYNLVNGRPNHVSPYLREHLRRWTGQELLVCSDAGAPSNLVDSEHYFATHEEAVAAALRAGVDSFTDHGTDSSVITGRIRRALDRGLLTESDIDTAVRRQLDVRARLGEFAADDPLADTAAFDTDAHRALAAEAAEQAVVLLKNDSLLPLAPGTRIAVVGLLAAECKLDWYSGTLLHRSTPLDGLRDRFGAGHVTWAEGADLIRLTCAAGALRVPAAPADGPGPATEGALDPALVAGRTDLAPLTADPEGDGTELALIDWGDGVLTLRAPDGRYLSVAEDGYVRASAEQPGGWVIQETFTLEPRPGGHLLRHRGTGRHVAVTADGVRVVEAGTPVAPGADGIPEPPEAEGTPIPPRADATRPTLFRVDHVERGTDAVARAAADADVVVVVAGNDPHINGRETEDRTTLALPPHQDALWRAAHAANPRAVLALVSAHPYAVPEADAALPALLWTAHGGQAAGHALARVLAGDTSPAGRLPQTWHAADADLPDLLDYDIVGSRQTYLYATTTPLYPFGHGLTYAAFAYDDLHAVRTGDTLDVTLTVTNTGDRTADEVPQLYVRPLGMPVPRPRRQLVGHRRVTLAAGAAERVTFTVPVADLGHWDVARGRWSVTAGTYELLAGASSGDIRRTARIDLDGDAPVPRPVRTDGLDAASYDDQHGTRIVDRTPTEGDAVTGPGELLYRACDFGPDGVTGVRITAAGAAGGHVELDSCRVDIPAGQGPYDHTTVTAAFTATGVRDLRVRLGGDVRLARIDFTREGTTA